MIKTIYIVKIHNREGVEAIAYYFDTEEAAQKRLDEIREIGISYWQISCSRSILNKPLDVGDFRHL